MMNEALLPMIFAFIRDPNSEISLGVVRSFDYLAARMSRELLEEKIIRPLLVQLGTDNWRNKCHIIEILRGFLVAQTYLNEGVLKVLFGLTDDRIDAVRLKANQLIIDIVAKNSKDWSEQYVVPKINAMKENASYLKRQNLLEIIEVLPPLYRKPLPSCPTASSRRSTRTPSPPVSPTRSPTCVSRRCRC